MSDMNPVGSDFQHASPSATNAGSHLLAQLFDCLGLRPKLYTIELSAQLHDQRLFAEVGNFVRFGEVCYCQKVCVRVLLAAADLLHSCPDGMTTSVDLEMPYSALRSSSMCILSATTDTNIHRDVVA